MLAIDHRLLHEHDYALVDLALHPASELPARLPIDILVPAPLKDSAALMPGLISLKAVPESLRVSCLDVMERQIGEGRQPLFCALLKSQAAPDRVKKHFCSTLVASAPGFKLYLRQFDPRLFVAYADLLTPQQWRRLFGPIDGWTLYLDGEWRTFLPPLEEPGVGQIRLTQEQATSLEDLQTVNEALAAMVPAGIELRQQRLKTANRLIARARHHGLLRRQDILLFVQHGLTIHEQFDSHPAIKQRLETLSMDADLPYLAAMAEMGEAGLERVRKEMVQGGFA